MWKERPIVNENMRMRILFIQNCVNLQKDFENIKRKHRGKNDSGNLKALAYKSNKPR